MRKIIAGFATTIDGFIEGPNGEIDWIIYDQEQFKELGESLEEDRCHVSRTQNL